jgi:hypothetical protein
MQVGENIAAAINHRLRAKIVQEANGTCQQTHQHKQVVWL